MASYETSYLYLLDQSGSSSNGKIVRELLPNSNATSTEQVANGTLMPGETFTTQFTLDPDLQATRGGLTFTYIGEDPEYPGMVAQGSDGNYYLFSNDGTFQPNDNLNGIDDTPFPLCFLAGTMIGCPGSERAVEELAIGDPVLTADGRSVRVKWLGRQTVAVRFGIPEGRRPVSIAAGAIARNMPARDLRLTADHALLIGGALVQAGALVNGSTIRRLSNAELGERFTVFHIETENHEVILAEGTPAETFVDNVSRRRFDNFAEYEAMYGGEGGSALEELPLPRAMSARQVPASIRVRIARRAAAAAKSQSNAA
jgi:hypothetical protein